MPAPVSVPYSGPSSQTESQIPNPPRLDENLQSTEPAVKDAKQALNICRSTEWGARAVIRRAAAVNRVVNCAPPFSPAALRQQGNAWQTNVSTGVMAEIIQQVTDKLTARLRDVQFLTAAKLPNDWPNAADKTAKYRLAVTETIRSWLGWNVFLAALCDEVVKIGTGFPTFPDPFDWKPMVCRVDEGFVPQGTPVLNQEMQYYIMRHDWDAYDLLDKIKNRDVAEASGWNLENCIHSIDAAHPKPRPLTGLQVDSVRFEDMIREVIPASTYSKGWNLVETYHLWNVETDGQVTEWIIDLKSSEELFRATRPMLRMKDLTLPMVFQYGNGKVYGSKGVGVQLFERCAMVEKARNRANDSLNLSGKMAVQAADAAEAQKIRLDVFSALAVLVAGKPVQTSGLFPDRSEAFLKQDKYWLDMMKQSAGVWMPMESLSDKTATQSKIDALNQNEQGSSIAVNILTQYQLLTGMIQRRLANPDSPTADSKVFLGRLINAGLSMQEIQMLANQSPTMNQVNFNQEQEKQRSAYLASLRGNPNYDQNKLERYISEPVIGPDILADILIPTPDQNQIAENITKQLLETPQLAQGVPMPVAPRDNHAVHLQKMQGQQNPATGQWQGPINAEIAKGNLPGANTLMAHAQSHIQAGQNNKSLGLAENGYKQWLAEVTKQYVQAQQQAAAQQQQNAALQAASQAQAALQPAPIPQ